MKLVDGCSVQNLFSAAYYTIQGVIYLSTNILVWVLMWNMKFEVSHLPLYQHPGLGPHVEHDA